MSKFLKILPNVEELLIGLKNCNVQSLIVSTDITSRAQIAMKTLKLDNFFFRIIGGDLAKKTKPEPDLALLALNELGFEPKNVVMIGDHPVDIMMGMSVKFGLNIGVLTGLSSNTSVFDNLDCKVIDNLKHLNVRC